MDTTPERCTCDTPADHQRFWCIADRTGVALHGIIHRMGEPDVHVEYPGVGIPMPLYEWARLTDPSEPLPQILLLFREAWRSSQLPSMATFSLERCGQKASVEIQYFQDMVTLEWRIR